MLDNLRSFLSDLVRGGDGARHFEAGDMRLAAAALLVHVADADGKFSNEERKRAQALVGERFQLDTAEAAQLVREAVASDHEEVGVDYFVNVLTRALDSDARLKIVSMMWDLVFADGNVNDAEDSMVWRIGEMLGVKAEELETLRRSRMPDTD
ncbi:MAG: TerB family tellurite resistance protein [Beijerinckiaceae bacterium]